MRTGICLLSIVALAASTGYHPAHSARPDLVTEFEKSGGKQTATYAQTADYMERLDRASGWVRVSSFGTSPEGRALQVAVVDRHGRFTPSAAHRPHNAVVMIQAGIHSGEIDGKDAGMMLIRAMAVDKSLASLLDHVTVLFIPIFNVDGHERASRFNRPNQNGPEIMGFRATATNLNLNRDYLKADTPEMRAWLALYNEWQPDFFIDCHVTDGADYQYVVTYSTEIWDNIDSELANWVKDRFIAPVSVRMDADQLPLIPYCNFRRWTDVLSGIQFAPSTPRFSTGYCALRNRPALLIETHMLKDYATRVRGTHEMLKNSLAVIGEESEALRSIVAAADKRSAALQGTELPVSFATDYTDSVMIDFLGVKFTRETSHITGGEWVKYSSTPHTFRIPLFAKSVPTASAEVPAAYIIPVAWTNVIERVKAHGLDYSELTQPASLAVSTYRFSNVKWAQSPFEGRHQLTYDAQPVTEHMTFAAGSIVVETAQPAARVIVNLLEPAGPDALVRWGLLDASFEQKEYFEAYALEAQIRTMLAQHPSLAKDFEQAREDSTIAATPDAIRRWFYERSPYYERTAGLYPVGRILDPGILATLPVSARRSR